MYQALNLIVPVKQSTIFLQEAEVAALGHHRIERSRLSTPTQRLIREMKVWGKLRHPNILPFIGFFLSDDLDEALLISQYEPRGSVPRYLKENELGEVGRFQLVSWSLRRSRPLSNIPIKGITNCQRTALSPSLRSSYLSR